MQHLFRLWTLLLLASGLWLTACSDDQKDEPAPTTGKLTGTVSPAGSITRVTATDAGGLTFLATPDATSGAFTVADLAPGTYVLSFETTTRYITPNTRSVSIVAGQTASAGTVVADPNPSLTIAGGTMSWTTDGQNYTTTNVIGSADASLNRSLDLNGTAGSGNNTDQLSFYLGTVFNGVGTYGIQDGYSSAQYTRLRNGLPTVFRTSSGFPGTLTVTRYDASAGVATGTFNLVASYYDGRNYQTVTITNGTFNVRF